MQTTDASVEQDIELFMEPIETEEEAETDEAPQVDETEPEEVETEDDASQAEDEEIGEADEPSDDEEGDEEADDDDELDESDEEQPEQRYTVKVDGEERTVTLDELQRGYSGQAYIQKGMEANKTQQRQLEEHAQTLQQQAQVVMQLYEQSQQTGFTPAPQEPDPTLAQTDPIAYIEADAAYKAQMTAYRAEQQQIEFLKQQQEAQQEAAMRAHMQEQERRLLEEMPELKDPKAADAFKGTLKKGVETYGYTQDELREIVKDVRSVKALVDAQKWRDLQAGKKAAKAPRETPKTVTKPKARRDQGRVLAQKKLQAARKSQKDDAWVDVLLTPNS